MWKETNVLGIFMAPITPYAVLAAVVYVGIRPILIRIGFQRWTWNTPLAETALYVCILAALVGLL